jgi:hypothetical protein
LSDKNSLKKSLRPKNKELDGTFPINEVIKPLYKEFIGVPQIIKLLASAELDREVKLDCFLALIVSRGCKIISFAILEVAPLSKPITNSLFIA